MTKWRIYEMLKRTCSINYAVLYRARKKGFDRSYH